MEFYKDQLVLHRKQSHMSGEKISGAMEICRTTYWKWEKGHSAPNRKQARKLAKILEIPVSDISNLEPLPNQEIQTTSGGLSDNINSWLSFFDMRKNKDFKTTVTETLKASIELSNNLNEAGIIIKALLSGIDSIFYLKNADLTYLTANEAFLKNIYLKPAYIVFGKTDENFFSKKEAKENTIKDERVLITGEKSVEEGFIPGSKNRKWGIITRTPIFDLNNKIVGLITNIVDITDRKNAEKRRSILEYSLNKVPFIVWLQDDNKNIVFVNDHFSDALDISKQDVYTKTKKWTDIQNSGFWKNRNKQLQDCEKFPKTFDYSLVLKGEDERFFRERIYKFSEKYQIGIVHDVTEFLELEKTKNDLTRLADVLEEIVSLSKYDKSTDTWKTEYINSALFLLSGIKKEKVLEDYKIWQKVIHPHDLSIYQEWYSKETYPKEIEYRILHQQTGEIVWIRHKQYKIDNKLYSTVKNIAIQKKLEKRQKELIDYNSIILSYLDKSILAYWIQELEPKNRILFVSDGYAKLYGVKREDIYNDNLLWIKFVHPDDTTQIDAEIQRCSLAFLDNNENKDFSLKYRIIDNAGCQKKVEVKMTVLYVEEKLIIGGFIREI